MKCDIIKDLLPLYAEGLCSDASREEIEEHLKNCEDCRKLAETPVEQIIPVEVPEEKNAMKKVSRKIKRSKLLTVLIGTVLAAVVGCICYLSYGQIVKGYNSPSFDTVFQDLEVRHLIRIMAKDPEKFAQNLSTGDSLYNVSLNWSTTNYEQMNKKDIENFVRCYKAAFGDMDIFRINVRSYYGADLEEPGGRSKFIVTDADVTFDDGRKLLMYFYKDSNLSYYCRFSGGVSGAAEAELQRSLNYISEKQDPGFDWIFTLMKKNEPLDGADADSISYWLKGDSDKLLSSINGYYAKGYRITDGFMSDLFYDPNRDMLFLNLTLKAEDSKGSAELHTRVYRDYNGYYAPDPADCEVYRCGCSDGLAEALSHYFG